MVEQPLLFIKGERKGADRIGLDNALEASLTIPTYADANVGHPKTHPPAVLGHPPIVPLGPAKQWAEEPVDGPLTLRVYPGADGSFAVYEDDGESFRYRDGEFTRIVCQWREGERTLALRSDPKGRQAAGKRVRVECVGHNEPVMVTLTAGTTRVKL